MKFNSDSADSVPDSRHQLLNVLDSVAEGIYGVDLNGECTYCNSSCLKLLRYDHVDELIGANMHTLIHHSHRDGTPYPIHECKIFNAFNNNREVHIDNEVFFRKDGTRFDAEYWSYPIQEQSRTIGAVVSFIDVTVRREEDAYRNHLARLVESSYDAIFSKDINGVITSWNQGAKRLFGYDPEEAIGRTAIDLILPLDFDDEEPEIRDAVRKGTELHQFEVKRRRKNGEICDVSLTISPILNADGEHIGSSFIERDITDRRKSRDELLKAKKAAEHAETLANVANRSRAEFLATVSHELRTPMNAILGLLQLTLTEKLEPTLFDYLKTAKASADSLLVLVNDILDFSKIESGNFDIAHAPFCIRDVINNAAKTLSPRAASKGLEILCEIDGDVPTTLVGDGLRILQVISNLLNNAIKFTDNGEILVKVVQLKKLPDEVRLLVSVADTGIGIHPNDQERIFSPFAQADMSLTRRQQGTGLGLAICSELLSLMGSSLKLQSEVGKGSEFSFVLTLPFVVSTTPVDNVPVELVKNLQVLVVDDNANNLRILEKIFVSWSMQPIVAESAEQALLILDQLDADNRPIALAVVDAIMPEIDGFELANLIARRDPDNHPPIVIMQSASELAIHAEKESRAPIANYVQKPISQPELLEVVLKTLSPKESSGDQVPKGFTQICTPTRSLSILVVEDLAANQKVARAILEKRGHQVALAGNGQEAVDRLQTRNGIYDVVLMDIQMPVMDGFQATAAIRALPDTPNSDIPIIAMTAHAMQGDREICLAAGMDAYVAKPFDAVRLIEVVEAIAQHPHSTEEVSLPPEIDSDSSTKPTRTEQQLQLVELDAAVKRLGGDQELFVEFVNIFMEDSIELVAQIDAAIESSNGQQLEKAAHALKGLMSNFGAKPCVELAQEFEIAGRQNRVDSISVYQDELVRLYQQLREELSSFVQ